MGLRGRTPLTEAAWGLRGVPINPPLVRLSIPGNPALRRGSPFFQLSAMDPSVSKSIPSGLALPIRRIACHAAALKGVPTKFLCRFDHPHLREPPQSRITVAEADGSTWPEQAAPCPHVARCNERPTGPLFGPAWARAQLRPDHGR